MNFLRCLTQTALIICLSAYDLTNCTVGQETKRDFNKELEFYQNSIADSQAEELKKITNPTIIDMVAIAERAKSKIYSESDSELRRIARDLDTKISDLLSNDVGKWMATKAQRVALFISFDSQLLSLSDPALLARQKRLEASISALKEFDPRTQGDFAASKSEPALAIIEDANWVEEMYSKLDERLSVIKLFEDEFPKEFNGKNLPTLQQAKASFMAEIMQITADSELDAKRKAAEENASELAKSVFDRDRAAATTKRLGDERIAELDRRLMEAQFGIAEMERLKGIESAKLQEREVGDEINTMKAKSEEERLGEYLTSDRVVQLLSPFCAKGLAEATTGGGGFKRIAGLDEAPMSLRAISSRGTLASDHPSMARLIAVANSGTNDRPSWPVDKNNYANAAKNFQNMAGEMVNPYIEAQRILREHGSKLVELKLLRP